MPKPPITTEERLTIVTEGIASLLVLLRQHVKQDVARRDEDLKRAELMLSECEQLQTFLASDIAAHGGKPVV